MKRAIITGATGFIGSWLALELLDEGYQITVVARTPQALLERIRTDSNCVVIAKDIESLSLEDFPRVDYDCFYNLSWAGVSPDKKNDVELQVSNIPLSLHSLQICHELGCKLYIATGTVAEYALTTDVMDLSAKQSPNDMYGCAKVSTHFFLEVQARKLSQPFIWTVVPSTFGERRIDDNIITYTIKSLLSGSCPHYGNLDQMWDFLYVSEVARALRLIGEKGHPGKVYGIGSGEYRPLRDYIIRIRDIINPILNLGIGDEPAFSSQSFSSCVNIYELIKDTGFRPQVSFDEGIRRTIRFWEKRLKESE